MPDREVGGLTGVPRAQKGGRDGSYVVWEGARAGGAAPAGHRHETRRVKGCRGTTSGERREAAERATERTPRPDKSEGGGSGWHCQMTPVVRGWPVKGRGGLPSECGAGGSDGATPEAPDPGRKEGVRQ